MIKAVILERRASVDPGFDGAATELFIVELHLAGCIEDCLWTMFCPFHIADAILKGSRNNGNASRFWIAMRCIGHAKLHHKPNADRLICVVLIGLPFVPGGQPSRLGSAPDRARQVARNGWRVL